jgi:hypothetical protein
MKESRKQELALALLAVTQEEGAGRSSGFNPWFLECVGAVGGPRLKAKLDIESIEDAGQTWSQSISSESGGCGCELIMATVAIDNITTIMIYEAIADIASKAIESQTKFAADAGVSPDTVPLLTSLQQSAKTNKAIIEKVEAKQSKPRSSADFAGNVAGTLREGGHDASGPAATEPSLCVLL